MNSKRLSVNITKFLAIAAGIVFISGCSKDITMFGTGMTPGAPAPYGVGANDEHPSTAEPEEFDITNNSRVKIQGRGGSTIYFGSEDGFLAGLKRSAEFTRQADSLVDGTRDTLKFMGITKDYDIDKTYHRIETGWYKGKYKATATINKKNLHVSSLDLKIVDRNGRLAPPQTIQEVEDAIFRRTKQINVSK